MKILASTSALRPPGKELISTQLLVFGQPDERLAVEPFDGAVELFDNDQSGHLLGGHSPASAIDLGQELFGQAPTLMRLELARGIQDIL